MNVDDFLDAVSDEDDDSAGGRTEVGIESVRKAFEHYFPNGAMDAGILGPLGEEEFSSAARQRDRQMFWEGFYCASARRAFNTPTWYAGEADAALAEWDKRWGKEGA